MTEDQLGRMKIGDRVIVDIPHERPSLHRHFTGTIVGEGRDGTWWQILRDGMKFPRSIHKTFCQPEEDGRHGKAQ